MRAAQLLLYPEHPIVLQELLQLAHSRYAMDESALRDFLIPLGSQTNEFAALLQVDIGERSDYQSIMARASEELVNLTVQVSVGGLRVRDIGLGARDLPRTADLASHLAHAAHV